MSACFKTCPYSEYCIQVIDVVGLKRIIAIAANNTGNTRVACEIIASRLPNVFNLLDPNHHLNNTWKDIVALDYFTPACQFYSLTGQYLTIAS